MSTYLITGGEGFIGYHICKKLSKRSDITIVTYDAEKHFVPLEKSKWPLYQPFRLRKLSEMGVEKIRGDTTNKGLVKETLEEYEPDYIIHLAALPIANISNKYPEEARRNIFEGTITMLDALREVSFHFERFVYTSSSMVYGDFPSTEKGDVVPPTEDENCDPLGLYGSMKLSGEQITKAYGHRFDMPYTIIRPSAVYGPTDTNRRVTEIFLRNALEEKPLRLDNGGHHKLDFTFVEDLAEGFITATEHENAQNETFNMTRGEGRSVRELAEVIADVIPETEMYSEERPVYRPNRGALDISKARRLLDFNPEHSLEQGIRKTHEFIVSFEDI